MNYARIKPVDVANGPGIRVALFVSGCTHRCPGCFNPETWDFDYGDPFGRDTEDRIIKLLEPRYIAGLSLLGGEPFEPANQEALVPFIRRVRETYPGKGVWAWSGYTLEQLLEMGSPLLELVDVLVDGEFHADEHDLNLRFRGSGNQRIIVLKEEPHESDND